MKLKRTTVVVEERVWEKFQTLLDQNGKPNGSYHLREAMSLYLKVLKTEARIFEIRDQGPEESLHAFTSMAEGQP